MIPRVAHFVFGLREQNEPFHFLHYVSLESCRRVLQPDRIYLHHKHLPWGPWWERVRPQLTLVEVDHVDELLDAGALSDRVPAEYVYAHHADFIRLDALIEHGGVYADIDTIFVRPFPGELFDAPFVIGREPDVRDERTGELRPSLCNALLMAEPGTQFARAWRSQMAGALNGTWSAHSGFLSERLCSSSPTQVRVEPEVSFFPFPSTRLGLSNLLQARVPLPAEALSVHLWAHLWWDRRRRDFSLAHAGWCSPPFVAALPTTLAELVRPYLPRATARGAMVRPAGRPSPATKAPPPRRWGYLSLDEDSGYGIAARRCMAALDRGGIELQWTPFVNGGGWGLGYEPALPAPSGASDTAAPLVVAHLVPEYLPHVRARMPKSFLVAHTVWDTDRIPGHWVKCLNHADLVVVPSRFSAEAIRSSAVSPPVEIVPHVAPPPPLDEPVPVTHAHVPDEAFVFYTIGEWTERKAISKTVEAYLRAFRGRDHVLLIVKTSHFVDRSGAGARETAGRGTTAWSLAQLLAGHADPPAIRLVTRTMTDAEITALHQRGDCYVSLARSEGFGLGAFDAAAHGNPVVMTGFGGQLDFLSDSPYLVNFDLVSVVDPMGFPSYAPDQRWAEPDVEDGAALLRKIAADPRPARQFARRRALDIRSNYRPAAIASAFRAAVERHFPGTTDRPTTTGSAGGR